jgi:hypothetical protein
VTFARPQRHVRRFLPPPKQTPLSKSATVLSLYVPFISRRDATHMGILFDPSRAHH